jgi:hypothetical protein
MYADVQFVKESSALGSASWTYTCRLPDGREVDLPVNMTFTAKSLAGRELSPDGWKAAGQLWVGIQVFEKKTNPSVKPLWPLDEHAEHELTQRSQWREIAERFKVARTGSNSS